MEKERFCGVCKEPCDPRAKLCRACFSGKGSPVSKKRQRHKHYLRSVQTSGLGVIRNG